MKTAPFTLVLLGIAILVGCAGCSTGPRTTAERLPPQLGVTHGLLREFDPPVPGADEIADAVRAVLEAQVADWNAGNIRGFMNGYSRTDSLRFISNGNMRTGWQNSLYAYVRNYPDRASMGTLSFEDLHIDVLAPNVAMVIGRYRLVREDDEPLGLFTLVLHEETDGWRIIHDHTSSSP